MKSTLLTVKSGSAWWIFVYEEERGMFCKPRKPSVFPYDLAWATGRPMFVTTALGDQMVLYCKGGPAGYDGTAIRCPVGVAYQKCSWNPKGDRLAVVCNDGRSYREQPVSKLGLYDATTERFLLTDIPILDDWPVWKDDVTVYALRYMLSGDIVLPGNFVLEISLTGETPKVVQTIPLPTEALVCCFYGFLDNKPLFYSYDGLQLGDKLLVQRDPDRDFRTVLTSTHIFVSMTDNLIVFDHTGRQIDRMNSGMDVWIGSIGRDASEVYGLAGNKLLRIRVDDSHIRVEEVCNLDETPWDELWKAEQMNNTTTNCDDAPNLK